MLFSSVTLTPRPDETIDFSRVIRDNVNPEARVVDIVMLGAHNAFTGGITKKSAVCPHDRHVLTRPFFKKIAPGMLYRFTKTQKSDAAGLLQRGVRYFDVRLTYFDNTWHTHHRLISAPLEKYLIQIIDFLHNNPGELIIFDIQHVNMGNGTFNGLWNFIASVTFEGRSLFDFVTYNPFTTPLGTLTLGEATKYGAAAVILAKTPAARNGFHYEYQNSVVSIWHNKIQSNELIAQIQHQSTSQVNHNTFRVNQAQTTPNFDNFKNAAASLFSWSILSHNSKHNIKLLNHGDFMSWFEVMPIFMVDFSDSPRDGFNRLVIEKINEFNNGL